MPLPVYTQAIIERTVTIEVAELAGDTDSVISERISSEIEGRCIVEGFVRPGSVEVLGTSAGALEGSRVVYTVVVSCDVCSPAVGEVVACVAKNVTKAGVRAGIDMDPSPLMIFLARDHHHRSRAFNEIAAGSSITVKIIGQRFELNDPYVSAIAVLDSASSETSEAPAEES